MKAVIYLRVSTKEQAEEGYSIPALASMRSTKSKVLAQMIRPLPSSS